jgi:predicted RNA-binding Zn ribbon-like protein
LVRRIEVAASLVNELATTTAGGRVVPPPNGAHELGSRAERALSENGALRRRPNAEEVRGLERLAGQLRKIFVAVRAGRGDDAAELLNELLAASGATPHLHRGGSDPWRLHFHGPDAGLVEGWTAGCAVGLAYALGSGYAGRLGICAGPDCERVFVDLSRNGSRRFCSTACQNRVKAAHYRARHRQSAQRQTVA